MTTIVIALLAALGIGGSFGAGTADGYDLVFNVVNQLSRWDNSSAALSMASEIYNYIKPMGMTLALGFAILEIVDNVTRAGTNNVTVELVVMPLIKFIMAYVFIMYGMALISATLGASNAFVDKIDEMIAGYSYTDFLMESDQEVNGTLSKIILQVLPGIFALISQIVACVIVAVQLISIRLEILIRAIFFPLACASIVHSGVTGPGMRYVKNLIANVFILGGILLIVKLVYLLICDLTMSGVIAGMSGIFLTIFGIIFNGLIGPFTCIGTITAVKSTLKEAFGA